MRARAVLRTYTVYRSRPALRVAYQLFDADENTRVAAPSSVVLTLAFAADGSTQQVTCGGRDGTSGVGLCAVNVADAKFSTAEARTATLSLSVDGATMLDAFAAVALARAPAAAWGPSDNFVIGGQLPTHPVYATDETFTLDLYAKSEAPSAAAGLATYQVDVWQVKVTWSPADALSAVSFAASSTWLSSYTEPAPAAASGDSGLVILVNTIDDINDANTYGAQLSLGTLTLRANSGYGGQDVAVVVTKQQMVAFSNGIILGDADVDGPLDGARRAAVQRCACRAVERVRAIPRPAQAANAERPTCAPRTGARANMTALRSFFARGEHPSPPMEVRAGKLAENVTMQRL